MPDDQPDDVGQTPGAVPADNGTPDDSERAEKADEELAKENAADQARSEHPEDFPGDRPFPG